MIEILERNRIESSFGCVLQIKVFTKDYQRLGWEEIWAAFVAAYPGKWALQVFPPESELVNGKHVYHLFVLDDEPQGLNLRG